MTRLHADLVEVTRRDDEPAQFLWRGRLYAVREVLSRWTEAGGWWRSAAVRAVSDSGGAGSAAPEPGPLETAPIPSSPKWAQRAWGEPAPEVGAAVRSSTASVDDDEQDWFRVEAAAGRSGRTSEGTAGVYDLCFSWSSGSWSLCRVLD